MSARVLCVIPPHASSMGNGPSLAPFLLRQHFAPLDVALDLCDANAHFFHWLLEPAQRASVRDELELRLRVMLARPALDKQELSTLGRLLGFRFAAYANDRGFTFARSGIEWAPVSELLLEPTPAWKSGSWRDAMQERAHVQLAETILRHDPDHLAVSILFHTQTDSVIRLCRAVREQGFRGKIILGGAAVKVTDDRGITDLLRRSGADIAYRLNLYFPPETMAPFLLSRVPAGAVEHACHLNSNGELVSNPGTSPRAKKLPGPLDYSGVDVSLYQKERVFPVLLSEGCYWGQCEFCDYPFLASQDPFLISTLFRNPAAVVADVLSICDRYGVTQFDLISDAVPLRYFAKMKRASVDQILSRGASLSCSIRAEPNAREEYFRDMTECGVNAITIGVESLCDDILAKMKKGNTYADIRNNLNLASKFGLRVKANIIFDYPRMTVEHVRLTRERLQEIAPFISAVGIHSFGLTPHAPLAANPGDAGLVVLSESQMSNDHGHHHLQFRNVNDSLALREELDRLHGELNQLAYSLETGVEGDGLEKRVIALPYRWTNGGAVRDEDASDLFVRVPDERQPFFFFRGENVPA